MHIVFNGWFWDQPFTGSGQYLQQLITTLKLVDSSLRLTLVLPEHCQQPENVPASVQVVRAPSSPHGHLGKVRFEQISFPSLAGKLGADIAHIPYWGGPLSSPIPQVVTIHDVIPLSMATYREGMAARLYFSLVTASAKGASHIITDSEFSKREIIDKIGMSAAQVTAIPLAATEAFHPRLGVERDAEIRERYQLPEHYALYLGGFDVRKNVRALIAAYTYVGPALGEEYPLVLAGQPPHAWGSPRFPDIPAEINARPALGNFIRWLGPVAEADKAGIYRMADVFAFPSRYEGFGLGALEAMACGTPVVAANTSSIPEVVGEAGYLVDPEDSRALGGALIAVMIQQDLHDNLRNLGLARATQFSWRRTARETLAIYQQVYAAHHTVR